MKPTPDLIHLEDVQYGHAHIQAGELLAGSRTR